MQQANAEERQEALMIAFRVLSGGVGRKGPHFFPSILKSSRAVFPISLSARNFDPRRPRWHMHKQNLPLSMPIPPLLQADFLVADSILSAQKQGFLDHLT